MDPAEGQRDSLSDYSSRYTAKSSNIMAGNTLALPSEVTLKPAFLDTVIQKSSQSAKIQACTLAQFHFREKKKQFSSYSEAPHAHL